MVTLSPCTPLSQHCIQLSYSLLLRVQNEPHWHRKKQAIWDVAGAFDTDTARRIRTGATVPRAARHKFKACSLFMMQSVVSRSGWQEKCMPHPLLEDVLCNASVYPLQASSSRIYSIHYWNGCLFYSVQMSGQCASFSSFIEKIHFSAVSTKSTDRAYKRISVDCLTAHCGHVISSCVYTQTYRSKYFGRRVSLWADEW